jgi:tetratricopeptide (TPR) repeat protein
MDGKVHCASHHCKADSCLLQRVEGALHCENHFEARKDRRTTLNTKGSSALMSKKLLVVSAPMLGPDPKDPKSFTFPVMANLKELYKRNRQRLIIAYDWPGSSNCDEKDVHLWTAVEAGKTLEEKTILVKQTRWWASYTGGVKSAAKFSCQDGHHTLMVCIRGGPISRVEAQAMPQLREEIISDLESEKIGMENPVVEIVEVESYQELEKMVDRLSDGNAQGGVKGEEKQEEEDDDMEADENDLLRHCGSAAGNFPTLNSACVGRDEDIRRVREALLKSSSNLVEVVAGPGIGKTTLAIAALQNLEEGMREQLGSCWFVSLRCVSVFDLNESTFVSKLSDVIQGPGCWSESTENWFVRWIGARPRCTIVFDNAEDLLVSEAVKDRFAADIDRLLGAGTIKVLLTTRNKIDFGGATPSVIELNALSATASEQLLVEIAGVQLSTERELAQRLGTACGHVPLALEMVGKLLASGEEDPEELLDQMDEFQQDLVEESLAISFPFERLNFGSGAMLLSTDQVVLLKIGVFESSFTLKGVRDITGLTMREAKVRLRRLVNRSLVSYDAVEKRYELHLLVREFTKKEYHKQGGVIKQTWAEVVALANIHYFRVLAKAGQDWASKNSTMGFKSLIVNQGTEQILRMSGDELKRLMLVNGPDMLKSLQTIANVGVSGLLQARYPANFLVITRFYGACAEVCAEAPADTALLLRARSAWAQSYINAAEAMSAADKVVEELRMKHSAHRSVGVALQCLAVCKDHVMGLQSAISTIDDAVKEHKKQPGWERNLDAADAFYIEGKFKAYMKQWEGAEEAYNQALEIRKQVLGERHAVVGMMHSAIARMYQEQERWEEAEKNYLQAIDVRKEALGERHTEVADTYHKLAFMRCLQKQWDEATLLYQKTLEIKRERLGEVHWRFAETCFMMAEMFQKMHKWKEITSTLSVVWSA